MSLSIFITAIEEDPQDPETKEKVIHGIIYGQVMTEEVKQKAEFMTVKPMKPVDNKIQKSTKQEAAVVEEESHPIYPNLVNQNNAVLKLRGINIVTAEAQVEDRPMKVKQNAVTEPWFNTEGWNRGKQIRVVKEKQCKIDRLAKLKKPTMVDKESCKTKDNQRLNFDCPRMATVCVLESFSDYMRLVPYDGNPEIDFDKWLRSFNDLMEAEHKTLSSTQKLAKLKCYLVGPARDKVDIILQTKTDFDEVTKELKKSFEDVSFRSLASAKLSLMEGKMVHEDLNSFVIRFEKLAKQATAGLSDEVKAQKMLDEFLLKLDPELAFLVRQTEPDTYAKALDVARKNEVFLKLKNIDAPRAGIAPIQTSLNFKNLDIYELARQVAENLRADEEDSETNFDDERYYDANDEDQSGFDEDQLGYSDDQDEEQDYCSSDMPFSNQVCYYCGKQGHVVRYCYQRMIQEEEEQKQHYEDHQVNAVNTRTTREEILKLKLQNECLKRQNDNLAMFGKPF
uniref:CCHC-type domain-containing protein n=1 Tax=Panagrolaimus davidi TaxID=227884 RepID=A0A914QH02_9BILA